MSQKTLTEKLNQKIYEDYDGEIREMCTNEIQLGKKKLIKKKLLTSVVRYERNFHGEIKLSKYSHEDKQWKISRGHCNDEINGPDGYSHETGIQLVEGMEIKGLRQN